MTRELIVLGLGYVGLPLAVEAARAGLEVTGFDTNADTVASLMAGSSHIDDLSDADVADLLGRGFSATADDAVLAEADTIVVCVPTPLSEAGGPDLRAVLAAMTSIGQALQPGTLVILESTTFPGTTEDVVAPMLEHLSGLRAGHDFNLAFSPERIDPGNPAYGIGNTPKIVGGLTSACAQRAEAFYERFIDTVVVARGTREAETAKLLENTYRHVNIALVNEMARFCHELGIDLWDVIRLASTKPFGFQAFYPGPGVGGHCIPIDPNYLSHTVRTTLGYPFRFVELAQEINASMPAYVTSRAQDILNEAGRAMNGAAVLLLGVTYKADVSDQRESPAIALARQLLARRAVVSYHDPHVTSWAAVAEAKRVEEVAVAAAEADLVILVQHHREYDAEALARVSRRFFDTRGVTQGDSAIRL